jgi:hypothetical protein
MVGVAWLMLCVEDVAQTRFQTTIQPGLTFLLKKRNQEKHRFWCVVSSIGKPVRIRHGPATVIVEGWPECH